MNGILPGGASFRPLYEGMSAPAGSADGKPGFGDVLKNAIQQVDQLHAGADQQVCSLMQCLSFLVVGSVMVTSGTSSDRAGSVTVRRSIDRVV